MQILGGLHGLERRVAEPPPVESPYESDAALLPTSLIAADSAHDAIAVV